MADSEEDVDSGWELDEEDAPVTRAVDSRRLLAEVQARLARAPGGQDAREPSGDREAELPPISEAPSTRRASEEELQVMRAKAAGSAIRLAGRRETPLVNDAASKAQEFDHQVYTRPTPPAPRPAVTPRSAQPAISSLDAARIPLGPGPRPVPPTAPPQSPPRTTSLRLPADSPRRARDAARKKTAITPAVRPPSDDSGEASGQGRVSQPLVDLSLDLDGAFGESSPPSQREESGRHEAVTRPPPPPAEPIRLAQPTQPSPPIPHGNATLGREHELPQGDDFDDLPIDEVLASVHPSAPPRESAPMAIPKLRSPRIHDELAATVEAPRATAAALLASQGVDLSPVMADEEGPSIQIGNGGPAYNIDVSEVALSDEEVAAIALDSDDPELQPVQERFERGDFVGAARRAEALLAARPDFEAARRYLVSANDALAQMYLDKLGTGSQVLRLAMRSDEIQGLSLDHRAGFLMSLIDGIASIDDILDMASMPRLEILRLLYEMREQGVLVVDSMRL